MDNYDYLNEDFDPTTLTIPQLRRIFIFHDIEYMVAGKKQDLLATFRKEIIPRRDTLRQEFVDVIPEGNDIVDVQMKGVKQDVQIEDGPQYDSDEILDDDIESDTSGPSSSSSPNRAVTDDTRSNKRSLNESESESPPRKKLVKGNSFTPDNVIETSNEKVDQELDQEYLTFDQANEEKYINGNEAQLDLKENRETLRTTFVSEAKRIVTVDATEPLVFGSSTKQSEVNTTPKPGRFPLKSPVKTPTANRDEILAEENMSPSLIHCSTPIDSLDLGNLSNSSNIDQQDYDHSESTTEDAKQKRNSEGPSFITSMIIKLSVTAFVLGVILLQRWYITEQFEQGYCGLKVREFPVPEYDSPVHWQDYFQREYILGKKQELANWARPDCIECPQNSICFDGFKSLCNEGFIKVQSPWSIGGFLPIAPECRKDTKRDDDLKKLKRKSLEILRNRNNGCNTDLVSEMTQQELRKALYEFEKVRIFKYWFHNII